MAKLITDAINEHVGGLVETVQLAGRRFDCGSVEGYMNACFHEFPKRC